MNLSGEASMAQVWLSFEEIQELFHCDAADARRRVVANQWERRRCGDGLVRAQVPPDVAHQFFAARYWGQPQSEPRREPASEFEAAMRTLCHVFAAEADPLAGPERAENADAQVRTAA
jgi:hypothetical protein